MSFLTVLLAALAGLSAKEHPIVRLVPDSILALSSVVEEEGEMVLSFRGDEGRVRERVRGRHWSLELEVPGVTRDAIVEFFEKQAGELSGGEVLRRADNRLTFRFRRPDGGESWCDLWATDGNYALEIVDEPPDGSPPPASELENAPVDVEPEKSLDRIGTIAFAAGTATLGPGAGAMLDDVAARLRDEPALRLELLGYSATGEPGELAERRARVVAEALALYGIATERLEVAARVAEEGGRVDIAVLAE